MAQSINLRRSRKETEAQRNWKIVETGVMDILQSHAIHRENKMDLYTRVYDLCIGKNDILTHTPDGRRRDLKQRKLGRRLVADEAESIEDQVNLASTTIYNKLQALLERFLQQQVKILSKNNEREFLREYQNAWTNYKKNGEVLNTIFAYINRLWKTDDDSNRFKEGDRKLFIFQSVVRAWNDNVFETLKDTICSKVFAGYVADREIRINDHEKMELVRNVVESIIYLGETSPPKIIEDKKKRKSKTEVKKESKESLYLNSTYHKMIEAPLMEATTEHYVQLGDTFLASNPSYRDYMIMCQTQLMLEEDRSRYFLPKSSEKIIKLCELALISRYLTPLLEEFKRFIENDEVDDLATAYSLIRRLDFGLVSLFETFKQHVTVQGQRAIENLVANSNTPIDPSQYIGTILNVHNRYNHVISSSFENDMGFKRSLDQACEVFINSNALTWTQDETYDSKKSAELLAKHCDLILKKSSGNADERSLDDMIKVFVYLADKDAFERYYSSKLGARLVNQTSTSDDLEKSALEKLKTSYGYEYVSKMQRMLTDIGNSKELNIEYKNFMEQSQRQLEHGFLTLILTSGTWSIKLPSHDFALPLELEQDISSFSEFYKTKHNGRKLTWIYQRSKGEVSASCFSVPKSFLLSVHQMGILLMYNTSDSYKLKDITETTKLSVEVAIQNLETLIRINLLTGELPQYENAEDEDSLNREFKLNLQFKHNKRNVNVPNVLPRPKAIDDTTKTDEEMIQLGRNCTIQACIVRIMKGDKEIQKNTLIAKVMEQLQKLFKPDGASIRKNIEILISKNYMEVKEEDKDSYVYVA